MSRGRRDYPRVPGVAKCALSGKVVRLSDRHPRGPVLGLWVWVQSLQLHTVARPWDLEAIL